ncbi:MAG TPA: FtsX-like permease family protein [Gammaproteobacteria bacterium]
MKQPYELSIAARYLRARRGESFISFISLVSMIGIGLAVAVLIVVTSVMDGFEYELQRRILGVVSHASIYGADGALEEWAELRERALTRGDVVGAAPFVEDQGMAIAWQTSAGEHPTDAAESAGEAGRAAPAIATAGLLIRGIDPALEPTVSDLDELMRTGSFAALEPGSYRILIGAGAAETLGVDVGDRLVLALAKSPMVTPFGIQPRRRSFTVAGIFDAGMYEYDQGLALVHIDDAARLFRTGGQPSGLRLAVADVYAAPAIALELARSASENTYVRNWMQEHVSFFASIRLSKSIMFVILSMVVAVAAFNIVSTLVMVVRDKRGDIAILRSFGAPPSSIMKVFASQGTMIGLVGTLFGLLLGLLVTTQLQHAVELIEAVLDVDLLSAEVYWLGELPSRLRLGEIGRICGLALLLAIAATFYPALAAARQPPAEALRYE